MEKEAFVALKATLQFALAKMKRYTSSTPKQLDPLTEKSWKFFPHCVQIVRTLIMALRRIDVYTEMRCNKKWRNWGFLLYDKGSIIWNEMIMIEWLLINTNYVPSRDALFGSNSTADQHLFQPRTSRSRDCLLFHLGSFGSCIPSNKPRIFSPRKKWAVWLRRGCFSFADPINTPAVLTINEGRGCRWLHPRHVHDCYKCRADCVISHDKVPLTLSLDPVSESSLRLLLTDEHLRNGASTRQLGENDGLPVGMTVNSPTERVAASYCLLTQSMLFKITLLHVYGPLLKAHMSFRRLYDKKNMLLKSLEK